MTIKIFDSSENELSVEIIHDKKINTFNLLDQNTKNQKAQFSITLSKNKTKASLKKICFSTNYDWSSLGISGVLKIEEILIKINVKKIIIQASLSDGLEVYFWTRCGYKPVLNNKDQNHFLMQKILFF